MKRYIFLFRLIHPIISNPLMPIILQWLDWEPHKKDLVTVATTHKVWCAQQLLPMRPSVNSSYCPWGPMQHLKIRRRVWPQFTDKDAHSEKVASLHWRCWQMGRRLEARSPTSKYAFPSHYIPPSKVGRKVQKRLQWDVSLMRVGRGFRALHWEVFRRVTPEQNAQASLKQVRWAGAFQAETLVAGVWSIQKLGSSLV